MKYQEKFYTSICFSMKSVNKLVEIDNIFNKELKKMGHIGLLFNDKHSFRVMGINIECKSLFPDAMHPFLFNLVVSDKTYTSIPVLNRGNRYNGQIKWYEEKYSIDISQRQLFCLEPIEYPSCFDAYIELQGILSRPVFI